MQIGDKVKKLIHNANVSQAAVSRATGIDQSQLCKLINGKNRWNKDHIDRIAKYFGVHPAYLLEENNIIIRESPPPKYDFSAAIRTDMIEAAIAVVENFINDKNMSVPPDRKSRIISKLYEHWLIEQEPPTIELAKKYFLIS